MVLYGDEYNDSLLFEGCGIHRRSAVNISAIIPKALAILEVLPSFLGKSLTTDVSDWAPVARCDCSGVVLVGLAASVDSPTPKTNKTKR